MKRSTTPPAAPSAAALVAAVRRGDAAAEQGLVDRYGRGLMYILRRETTDVAVAEDLYQECFRIALERLRTEGLEQPEKLAGFLIGIARRLVLAHQRKSARSEPLPPEETTASELPEPYGCLWLSQRAELVRRSIDALAVQRDRDLLRRRYLMDEDKPNICAALDMSPRQYDRALHRARQRLRKEIGDASLLWD